MTASPPPADALREALRAIAETSTDPASRALAESMLAALAAALAPDEAVRQWQRCPVCDGHGRYLPIHPLPTTNPYVECRVCHGSGVLATPPPVPEQPEPAVQSAAAPPEDDEPIGPFRVRSANCAAGDHEYCAVMVEQDHPDLGITECLCDCHGHFEAGAVPATPDLDWQRVEALLDAANVALGYAWAKGAAHADELRAAIDPVQKMVLDHDLARLTDQRSLNPADSVIPETRTNA